MRRASAGNGITKPLASCLGGAVLIVLGTIAVFGQETGRGRTESGSPYPRIPGAVTKPPAGIAVGAPFDVAKLFAAPSYSRNAAPLYLDALFEFGAEVASCFPEGPERDRRRQAAAERMKRYQEIADPLFKDPKSVPARTIDEVIRPYEAGFRKLAAAQRREQCVFETGLGLTTLLPHVQAARQVTRIASLRVRRAIDEEDFAAAIGDVEMVLRLARDLQPRGPFIPQLVAAAITQVVGSEMIVPILLAGGLRAEHCDRLLKVLVAHEAKSTDGYAEGLRAEYVMIRAGLPELVRNPREVAKDFGMPLPEDAAARLQRTTPAELSRQVETINRAFKTLLGLDGIPYSSRLQKLSAEELLRAVEPLSLVFPGPIPPSRSVLMSFAQGIARARATLRAMECWTALRRWQLSHRGRSPRELASATQAAGLKRVPTDPYDGKPMRMATLAGQPIIYSVGKDGKDDGGQRDSKLDVQPSGDLIYRPAPMEPRR